MSKLKVGDVCVIVDSAHFVNDDMRHLIGTECTVHSFRNVDPNGGRATVRCRDADGRFSWFAPFELVLKRPPSTYDGNQTGSWDLCPWRPSKVDLRNPFKERA